MESVDVTLVDVVCDYKTKTITKTNIDFVLFLAFVLMLKPLKFLFITTVLIFVLGYFVPGIRVSTPLIAAEVVLVLVVTNFLLGNILRIITLPLNRMSFGLIGFCINLAVIALTAKFIDGFEIAGVLPLIIFAISLSIVSYVIDKKIL